MNRQLYGKYFSPAFGETAQIISNGWLWYVIVNSTGFEQEQIFWLGSLQLVTVNSENNIYEVVDPLSRLTVSNYGLYSLSN